MSTPAATTAPPEPSGSKSPYLVMRNVSKTFGPIAALRDVSLDLRLGEIHALMGENGAGKSTLMKILSGAYVPDAGSSIEIDGQRITVSGPSRFKELGIATIYQELALSPNLTVAENIYLGREERRGPVINRDAMNRGAAEILDQLGATFGARDLVSSLSIAERQLVEIARALRFKSRVLIMDEPTTALSERETRSLFELILRLKEQGLGIFYISHRMNEVYELSDRVSVLRDGRYVGTLEREEIEPAKVVRMMVGRDISSFYHKEEEVGRERGRVMLSVRGLTDGRRVKPCSFDVHAGEILGIAGLVGAGRTELARLVAGADPATGGTIEVDGKPVQIRAPRDAMREGIAYLTEDRKLLGLFLDMTVLENVNMGVLGEDAHPGGVLNGGKMRRRSDGAIKAFDIRPPSGKTLVGGLSGGNQQKVLLARLLETRPRVLILDEPTRGVDIGAKSEIYRLIGQLANSGMAVAFISSELPEIIGIADRVIVMREGEIAAEIDRDSITQERIVTIATSA